MKTLKRSLRLIACAMALLFAHGLLIADDSTPPRQSSPPTTVLRVTPGNFIFHGIEVQTKLDANRQFYKLKGPRFFDADHRVNWYEVYKPKPVDGRTVTVTVGQDEVQLDVGDATYFGTPNQVLGSGPAKSIDQKANLYVAYSVQNPSVLADLLPGTVADKPVYLAVPTEEWHHDDYFGISQPQRGLVLAVQTQENDGVTPADSKSISVLDQFSLNRFQVGKAAWISFVVELKE